MSMTDFMEDPLSQIPPADPLLFADTPDPEAESQAVELEAWYGEFKRERAAESDPPADPTPSAAVAPTGGETVTDEMLRVAIRAYNGWGDDVPISDAFVRLDTMAGRMRLALRAALSSPVRAERGEAEWLRAVLASIADDHPKDSLYHGGETYFAFAKRLQALARRAALTPTPPATPTGPTDA